MRARRWATALSVAAVVVALTACSGEEPQAGQTPGGAQSEQSGPTAKSNRYDRPAVALPVRDGRHAGLLVRVLNGDAVVFDPLAITTGATASKLHRAEHLGPEKGPPNDYLTVNNSKELWSAPLHRNVAVRLVRLREDGDAGLNKGTVDELPRYIKDSGGTVLCWFVVRDHRVVEIEEQYTP